MITSIYKTLQVIQVHHTLHTNLHIRVLRGGIHRRV